MKQKELSESAKTDIALALRGHRENQFGKRMGLRPISRGEHHTTYVNTASDDMQRPDEINIPHWFLDRFNQTVR